MDELRAGSVLAGHELTRSLGAGAMGAVFEVRHLETGAVRALKTSRASSDPEDLERARREGEAMARLRHPNLLAVHDFGVVSGRSYLIVELAAGGSLGERLRGGPLSPEQGAALLSSLASALAAAHAAGVVHRDIKPDNVLLSAEGVPKLADFGLASLSDRSRLTETGTLLGTPIYMAPEQARGEQVGPPADVYALGATFYSALSGRPPVESAGSLLATLARIQDESPPQLSTLVPQVSPALSQLVAEMLRKEPRERPSAEDVAARACASPAPSAQGRLGLSALVGGLVLVALLALAVWATLPAPGASAPTSPPVQDSPTQASGASPTAAQTPRPLAAHVTSQGVVARAALEAYTKGEHCSTRLREAFRASASERREPAALVDLARDTSVDDHQRLVAQVALGLRGYLAWLTVALGPERPMNDDLSTLYLRLAGLGCHEATEELSKEARRRDPEAAEAWLALTDHLGHPKRFLPNPNWPIQHWVRAWPERVPARNQAWSQARWRVERGRADALTGYLEAFAAARTPAHQDRVALELQRVAEAAWVRAYAPGKQELIREIDAVLEVTEWGGGHLARVWVSWPGGRDGTSPEGWLALRRDLRRALALDPELRLAYQRLAFAEMKLGRFQAAMRVARGILLISPRKDVVDYQTPLVTAIRIAEIDLAFLPVAREALVELEGVARLYPSTLLGPEALAPWRERLAKLEQDTDSR